MWWAALETLQQDLLMQDDCRVGLWLAAPLPALYEPQLLEGLQGWVWAPEQLERLLPSTTILPGTAGPPATDDGGGHFRRLPLDPRDSRDPLLIVITPKLQLALALHGPEGERQLLMRSDASTLSVAWP